MAHRNAGAEENAQTHYGHAWASLGTTSEGPEAGIPSSGPGHGLILVELTTTRCCVAWTRTSTMEGKGSNHDLFVPNPDWVR
jgi:hypothetical protein